MARNTVRYDFAKGQSQIDNLVVKLDKLQAAKEKLNKKPKKTAEDENALVAKEFGLRTKIAEKADKYTGEYSSANPNVKEKDIPKNVKQIYQAMWDANDWVVAHLDNAVVEIRKELELVREQRKNAQMDAVLGLQEYEILQVLYYLLNIKSKNEKFSSDKQLKAEVRFIMECINTLRGQIPASMLSSEEVFDTSCEKCFEKWMNDQQKKMAAGTNPVVQKYLTQFGMNIKGK